MASNSKNKINDKSKDRPKKKYVKPEIRSEKLMTFGAICNGSPGGGRKSTAGSPDFCAASRLMS